MGSWQDDLAREARIQHQYEEWSKREQEKAERAADRGDFDTAKKFNKRAQGYNKKAGESIDRQAEIVPLPTAKGGCLPWLLFASLTPFILKGASRR